MTTNPQPAVRVDARVKALPELSRDDLQRRAQALLVLKGWKPGDTISLHGAIGLMVDLAADAVTNPLDRCAHPECGCDFDAVCNDALTPAPTEAGGVGEAAVDLLSHLKLHVMDKLGSDDADALHDCMLDLTAALACLKPGSRFTVDGVECVVVRKDALDWLNGEGDSFERPDNVRGNFWWRGEFRRRAMLSACEEN